MAAAFRRTSPAEGGTSGTVALTLEGKSWAMLGQKGHSSRVRHRVGKEKELQPFLMRS